MDEKRDCMVMVYKGGNIGYQQDTFTLTEKEAMHHLEIERNRQSRNVKPTYIVVKILASTEESK